MAAAPRSALLSASSGVEPPGREADRLGAGGGAAGQRVAEAGRPSFELSGFVCKILQFYSLLLRTVKFTVNWIAASDFTRDFTCKTSVKAKTM